MGDVGGKGDLHRDSLAVAVNVSCGQSVPFGSVVVPTARHLPFPMRQLTTPLAVLCLLLAACSATTAAGAAVVASSQ